MAPFGDEYVRIDALQRWVKQLSIDNIDAIEVGGATFDLLDYSRELLEHQLAALVAFVLELKPTDDWMKCIYVLSTFGLNAFFKVKNGSIRVANFYEALLKPGNSKTYKKIIKGYDVLTIGTVEIFDGDKRIASIGRKSDLIWHVFFDYFVTREESYEVHHAYANHEKYLSIQLYEVENKSQEEIDHIINEILLRVSMEHGLDFKLVELDATYKLEGDANTFSSQFHEVEYEYIPSLYFNNGVHSNDVRLAFLSFYQVVEYFFVRAQNYAFLDEFKFLQENLDHGLLRIVLQKYKNSLSERESLRLVLKRALDISSFKLWLNSNVDYTSIYCSGNGISIDLSKSDDKIIGKLVERIYSLRCSIAHAKGDMDEYIAIPELSHKDIEKELPLVKYIAFEVLKACSEV